MSDYIRPTELEIATAIVLGGVGSGPPPPPSCSPLQALEAVIRPALRTPPCRVAFSGGRDSSAVLAVATRLAARDGLEPPVPVTRVYPDAPRTDETRWQEAVIGHLGLTEWIRASFRDEHDLLGETARSSLRRHGVLWPPALHVHGAWYDQLGPGPLLTGEGGDDVIGNRRVAPLTALVRGVRPSRTLVRHLARAVAPRPLRRRALAGDVAGQAPRWLTPHARRQVVDAVVEEVVAEPLRYDRATLRTGRRRAWRVYAHNHARLATEHGVDVVDPLLDSRFVAALARDGGPLGFVGRTATMRALFHDLLPDEVLARRTKALFNEAYMGASVAAFARDWDGSGVNTDLVDVGELRAEWLSDRPAPSSALLLHQAWLHSDERADAGAGR